MVLLSIVRRFDSPKIQLKLKLALILTLTLIDTWDLRTGLIVSVQSNQFVQSKMRNCAVQKHKVKDIIVQFSKSYCCAVQDAAFF